MEESTWAISLNWFDYNGLQWGVMCKPFGLPGCHK